MHTIRFVYSLMRPNVPRPPEHPAPALFVFGALALASCSPSAMTHRPEAFDLFRRTYAEAADSAARVQLLENFWKEVLQHGTPLVNPDGSGATFLYRGDADSVKLAGDMTGWDTPVPLSRFGESDLFHLQIPIPRDARLDYLLVIDSGRTVLDPTNSRSTPGGYGPRSELAMPGFHRAPELEEQADVARGTLATIIQPSTVLGYDHVVHVYLPPGYEKSTDRYPVVYFQDGNDYLSFALAGRILDNVIAGGAIQPVIAVFVVPPVLPDRNRETEYTMNEMYARFLASELVPAVDARYRTLPRPQHRLAAGVSRGGLMSLFLAFRYPGVFGLAASQSGFVSFGGDSLIAIVRDAERLPLRLYLDAGLYETAVHLRGGSKENFLEGNRRLRDVLLSKGYGATYREFSDGHSWGRWRNEIPFILRHFFPWRL